MSKRALFLIVFLYLIVSSCSFFNTKNDAAKTANQIPSLISDSIAKTIGSIKMIDSISVNITEGVNGYLWIVHDNLDKCYVFAYKDQEGSVSLLDFNDNLLYYSSKDSQNSSLSPFNLTKQTRSQIKLDCFNIAYYLNFTEDGVRLDSLNLYKKEYGTEEVSLSTFTLTKLDYGDIKLSEINESLIIKKFDSKYQKNDCIVPSIFTLPYSDKLDVTHFHYTILNCKIEGFENWNCDGSSRYLSLPNKKNTKIILVPMDCGDFPYRFYMLSIQDGKVISSLYVKGEWNNPSVDYVQEYTRFSIDEQYIITVYTKEKDLETAQAYHIQDDGQIVKVK